MKKYLFFVGIDVSKSKLDVTFLENPLGKNTIHFVVSNDNKGIKEILRQLSNQKIALENVLISFEDTSVYSLPLGCYLTRYKIDYWMIPAIEIKRSKGISRGKTDKNDSKDIAFYTLTHLHKSSIEELPLSLVLNPPFCQTAVSCSLFFIC